MEQAERRWFQRLVDGEVRRFFGSRDAPVITRWPGVPEHFTREARVDLNKFEHIERLPELLDTLQALLARTRFRHAIWVSVAISAEGARGERAEWSESREPEEEDRRERIDEYERKQREQMDREHRFELRKSEGGEIDPEDFAAPPLDEDNVLVPAGAEGEKTNVPWQRKEIDPDEVVYDPDAWRFDPERDELSFAVYFFGVLTEEAWLVADYQAAQAQHYLRRKAEKLRPRES